MVKKEILAKNEEIRNKLLKVYPEDNIAWSWISTIRELIRLDNDDHEYLVKGFYKYKPLFRDLREKLKTDKIHWLNPASIFTYLNEGGKNLEEIAIRRMKKGYILILDGKELHEFSTLSEAQKTYDLPEPDILNLSE